MPAAAAPELSFTLEAMRARLQALGLPGSNGRRLALPPASLIIGRVCDEQPLLRTEVTTAQQAPQRLLRGLAAAGLLCGAEQLALAVDEEQPELLQSLTRHASGTRVELWPIAPRAPLDDDCLRADLAERRPALLQRALVLDAVALSDVADIVDGRPPLWRTVTVCGMVRRPAVLQAAIGAPLHDLVRACGGSQDPACALFHNGAPGGSLVDPGQPVEAHTRGLLVLPHDHPLLARLSVPVDDELRRAASACVGCRLCSDCCSAHLLGASLEPHRLLLAAATAWSRSCLEPSGLLCALECRSCGLCSTACPSGLRPATLVAAVARRLREQGVKLTAAAPLRPHPDRAGRRLSRARLAERLGLSGFAASPPVSGGVVLPAQLRVAACGPGGVARVPVVQPGEAVSRGDLLAMAPAGSDELDCRAAASGHVLMVDPDDGITVAVR
jgi:ferredoxin